MFLKILPKTFINIIYKYKTLTSLKSQCFFPYKVQNMVLALIINIFIYRNPLIYSQIESFPTHLLWIFFIIYIYIYISSSSCHAVSMDISDPLSPPLLSSIAFGRSTELHLVSAQSCCMYVQAGCPAFARHCKGVHRRIDLWAHPYFSQCPACLVRLTLIVFVTGGRWPYSCCFVGCCLQDLFNITCSILV